ncbi:class D beta-lactamase [Flammeovirga pacifica]|uniref:Beta-lactamase n=1 Tax=Flammeovirga pacifica TaxID=915059 RepID=A0A1S1YYN7_FLAPC|nr:class D beta-lactamase [Flammeovirga pacifica]OHX66126.1 class D beta-lactamase [Flammeovirga pacifica]
MKLINFFFILVIVTSCQLQNQSSNDTKVKDNKIHMSSFQKILDSTRVKGAILIYDLSNNKYYSNNFDWASKGKLPASTFKIPNSIIALETKIVNNDSSLLKWDGDDRRLKIWEQDLIMRDAFHYSCVPCYQDIARKIGVKKMNHYLDKLNYGHMEVDSTNLDLFWLVGASEISQFEQIEFLKSLYNSNLPISQKTEKVAKRMMIIESDEHHTLRGKTGWSVVGDIHNAWFVGYLEREDSIYFFATNISPDEGFKMKDFSNVRIETTLEAINILETK